MSLFINNAWAQAAEGTGAGSVLTTLLPLVLLFALFYFMLIRPQHKRQKQHREMVAGIQKGDEVATTGGTLGRVSAVNENFITLEIAKGVEIKLQRHAISTMLPKGTIKDA